MKRVYKSSPEKLARVKQWQAENKEHRKEYLLRWRQENPEKFKANLHARRARKKGASGRHTAAEWMALNEAFGWRCLRCGIHHSESPLTRDHVVPLADGGANDIANIQPLCLPCNLWKNARTIDYRLLRPEDAAAAEAALDPLRGYKKSPPSHEVRQRISKALTGYKHGEATRENMARGVKDSWTRRGARSDSSSGVRGVIWDGETGKWRAVMTVNGKKKSLGRYQTIEEASAALVDFRRTL